MCPQALINMAIIRGWAAWTWLKWRGHAQVDDPMALLGLSISPSNQVKFSEILSLMCDGRFLTILLCLCTRITFLQAANITAANGRIQYYWTTVISQDCVVSGLYYILWSAKPRGSSTFVADVWMFPPNIDWRHIADCLDVVLLAPAHSLLTCPYPSGYNWLCIATNSHWGGPWQYIWWLFCKGLCGSPPGVNDGWHTELQC